MPFDGIFTLAMTEELSRILTGGRIGKIYQPYKNEIVIAIRAGRKNHRLFISAHPSYARIQLTDNQFENPAEPPLFCIMMRKHIEGATIEKISQFDMDRIMIIDIKSRDDLGDISYKQLIIEIMGRHSNITLIDKESMKIIDSIKHIPAAINSYRTVLPGADYKFPPAMNKLNPLEVNEEEIRMELDFNSGKLDQQLVQKFSGISPVLAREIIYRSGLANRTTVPGTMLSFIEKVKTFNIQPSITKTTQKEDFYIFELSHLNGEVKLFSSLSELLDRYYFGKADRDRVKQQANDLEKFIKNERDKNITKIKKLNATLEKAKRADEYQLQGELLTAHLHLVKKGMAKVNVMNYYDESGKEITIQLDPLKTPAENAQAFFTKYQKAKNSISITKEQITLAEREVEYFDRLLQQLSSATTRDIEEIREELAEEGYLKLKSHKRQKKKNSKPIIETYEASDGTEILVGKNNKQNDYITNKLARRDEIWLHTKDIPGSHVVIRSTDPSEQALEEAAMLAAYFSKAKESSSVPVDFTKVRYVRKPNGAKPGFVIYDNQQTIFVTPDEDQVSVMRKR